MNNQIYTTEFFNAQKNGSYLSAKQIIPMLLEFWHPGSVVDVGCGVGPWLAACLHSGIKDITGIDGPWVKAEELFIPKENFVSLDLTSPFALNRKFDLAISLEIAEHLPETSAQTFIDSLSELAPVILFSAAIPLQGGQGHINCQWPEYWINLFNQKGFKVIDYFRKRIWNNQEIRPWYRQNLLLFVKDNLIKENEFFRKEHEATNMNQLSLVHPEIYLYQMTNKQ